MGPSHRNPLAVVAAISLLVWLGLLSRSTHAAGSARIIEGSNVTLLYQITVPGEGRYETPHFTEFIQGRHQLPHALERLVTGMKSGDKKSLVISGDIGFGPYDTNKRKIVPREELPSGVHEGDLLQDKAGKSATVIQLSEGFAVMDYNHPLAGKYVVVKIMILRVDDPR
jgi:FKBP-type peptidyl-prolyl cis-trans isomerase 2